jgi:hypothetical protein
MGSTGVRREWICLRRRLLPKVEGLCEGDDAAALRQLVRDAARLQDPDEGTARMRAAAEGVVDALENAHRILQAGRAGDPA